MGLPEVILLWVVGCLVLLDSSAAFSRVPSGGAESKRNIIAAKKEQAASMKALREEAAQQAQEMEGRWRDAFVTYVANEGYIMGARVLGASLRATGIIINNSLVFFPHSISVLLILNYYYKKNVIFCFYFFSLVFILFLYLSRLYFTSIILLLN